MSGSGGRGKETDAREGAPRLPLTSLHECPGCYSPGLWDFQGGLEMSLGEVLAGIGAGLAGGDVGVTLTGGDPLCQPEAAAALCVSLREARVHTVVYTGFVYEDIVGMSEAIPALLTVLEAADVLVDGPYLRWAARPGRILPYSGSPNQRIIDLQATRKQGQVVELDWPVCVSLLSDGTAVLPVELSELGEELGVVREARACGQCASGRQRRRGSG